MACLPRPSIWIRVDSDVVCLPLHGIEADTTTITIRFACWRFKDVLAKDMLLFVAYITDGHSRMSISRINEVHREFADEATNFELRHNILVCTDVGKFVRLIEMDKKCFRLCLRQVILRTEWRMSPLVFPKTKDLHSILAYAKSNLAATIQIRLSFWRFKVVLPKTMLLFVAYGRGIREAVRGQRSVMSWPGDSGMLRQWQGVSKVSGWNACNVKLPPAEDIFDEAAFRFQVSLALRKTTTSRHTLTPYHLYRPTAIVMLVKDVRGWYENGV